MKKYFALGLMGLVAGLALTFSGATARAAAAAPASTLDNLQAAYNGEVNAEARFGAFAKKADAEGFKGVASLFRAAAKSESLHAAKHAAAIKKLNAKPASTPEKPEIKSTKENLEASIADMQAAAEKADAYATQAETDKNSGAVMTFKGAKISGEQRVKLLKAALGDLDNMKAAKDFYVCTVCGYTMDKKEPKCPLCSSPPEKFVTVN